ncbi:Mucin [Hirschfeldia incana]|nr:Mucin [Hirschfeldia incana]
MVLSRLIISYVVVSSSSSLLSQFCSVKQWVQHGLSTLCLKSSEDPSGWESVRGEQDEYAEDSGSDLQQHYDRLSLRSCDSPSDPPSHQNFDVSGYVGVEEQVEEDIMKEDLSVSSSSSDGETLSGASLIQEYCAGNLTSATTHGDEESLISNNLATQKVSAGEALAFPGEESVEEVRVESFKDYVSTEAQSTQSSVESFGYVVECNDGTATLEISMDDSNLNPTDTKSSNAHVEDNVANMRSSNEDNPDDITNRKPDVAPLDTIALSGMTLPEDPSYVDDNELYALHARTKKLRSVKRKILDALATKRIREKEYEQLAIWFGDADMGSDLVKEDSEHEEAVDSQWELL